MLKDLSQQAVYIVIMARLHYKCTWTSPYRGTKTDGLISAVSVLSLSLSGRFKTVTKNVKTRVIYRETYAMHISGDELHRPKKTFVKNVDISAENSRRKRRV